MQLIMAMQEITGEKETKNDKTQKAKCYCSFIKSKKWLFKFSSGVIIKIPTLKHEKSDEAHKLLPSITVEENFTFTNVLIFELYFLCFIVE